MTSVEIDAKTLRELYTYSSTEGEWRYESLFLWIENTSTEDSVLGKVYGDLYRLVIRHEELGYYAFDILINDDIKDFYSSLHVLADEEMVTLQHVVKFPTYSVRYDYISLEEAEYRLNKAD